MVQQQATTWLHHTGLQLPASTVLPCLEAMVGLGQHMVASSMHRVVLVGVTVHVQQVCHEKRYIFTPEHGNAVHAHIYARCHTDTLSVVIYQGDCLCQRVC